MLTKKQQYIKEFEIGFLPFILWTGAYLFIKLPYNRISQQCLLFFLIAMTMMFIGNTNLLHLIGTFVFGLLGAVLYSVSAEYRLHRIEAFLGFGEPNSHETASYQLNQALIAIGNGGLFGVGTGQNRQSQHFPA